MDLINLQSIDRISTDDLHYVNQNGKYTYSFSYLGEGLFFIKSKGYLDEESFKQQLFSGDIARERLFQVYPILAYNLLWDVSEVSGMSFFVRRLILSRIRKKNYETISIIGANLFSQTYIKLIYNIVPHIKFYFFRTIEDAIANFENIFNKNLLESESENFFPEFETESYSRFIDIWQITKKTIFIGGNHLKYISKPEWKYISPDGNFKIELCLLEGNVILNTCEGYTLPEHVDIGYSILRKIIHDLQFSKEDKFYTILDIKKLKGISLAARKKTAQYESMYKYCSYHVFAVTSHILLLIYKVIKKVSKENFNHWEIAVSVDDAWNKILSLQKGKGSHERSLGKKVEQELLIIPKNKLQMIELIQKQHNELQAIKLNQQEQIQKILSFTGNMTWDESFVPPLITNDEKNPFTIVYHSLSILFDDFKEIIEETSLKALQLQESEDKYRNLINLASDVIAVYQENKLCFVNSRVLQVFGYTQEEVFNKPMFDYVASEEIPVLQDFYNKRMLNMDVPWIYETVFIHKDGHRIPVSMSVGKVIYEGKSASMIITRDITQKKKIEEELEKYRNHLEDMVKKRTEQLQKEVSDRRIAEESDRLKTAFLANMSHEIRTPMNAIIAFSNFLKEPGLSQELRDEYLNFIQSSGHSLLNLINDIIDISKIEAKQLNIQLSLCKIDPLMDELYHFFEQTRKNVNKEHIRFILEIPPQNNILLYTDPNRLKQILSNLLDNALKFTDKGFITFGYRYEKKDIIFYVKDSGIGIPADKMDLIFKRFGRLHTSIRNIGGTGLGLAISKNLANLLNGELRVESYEKEGSAFYLQLPNFISVDEQEEYKAPVNDKKSEYNWADKRILIAEDEDLNFRVLQIALLRTGAELVRVKNGKAAVTTIAEDNNFDIVLMDIQMPIMDGYEAMALIKKLYPQKPVIAQTAFALFEERKKCIDLGFDDYLAKPIHLPDLYSKMDVFLKE